jgi:hypothetical protein
MAQRRGVAYGGGTMINLEIIVAKQRVDMSYKTLQDAWKALQDAQLQHALYLEEFDKCSI